MRKKEIEKETRTHFGFQILDVLSLQLEDLEVAAADYVKPTAVANFKKSWEDLPPESERENDYGMGTRDGLQVR